MIRGCKVGYAPRGGAVFITNLENPVDTEYSDACGADPQPLTEDAWDQSFPCVSAVDTELHENSKQRWMLESW